MAPPPSEQVDAVGKVEKVSRVVDMRLPLSWLLTVTGSGIATLFLMWTSTNQLVRDMADVQQSVKAMAAATQTMTSEITLLKFRADTSDANVARLQQQVLDMQSQRSRNSAKDH